MIVITLYDEGAEQGSHPYYSLRSVMSIVPRGESEPIKSGHVSGNRKQALQHISFTVGDLFTTNVTVAYRLNRVFYPHNNLINKTEEPACISKRASRFVPHPSSAF